MDKIVVVGCAGTGGPAAMMLKTLAPDIEVTVIREEENFLTRCATPYIANGDVTVDSSVKDDTLLLNKGITLVDQKAIRIDRAAKQVVTDDGSAYTYDKLVLATGARAVVPPIEGANLNGVHVLRTSRDATSILKKINDDRVRQAIVIGAGAVGLEIGYLLTSKQIKVCVVEMLDRVLPTTFDSDMSEQIEQYLEGKGIELRLNARVEKILGSQDVEGVELSTGENLDAQIIIASAGVKCNTELARDAGLDIGSRGVKVNEYLQTSDPDIYAAGDLVEYESAITGKPMLGQIRPNAVIGGRVIAKNVLGHRVKFPPLVNSFATKLFDMAVAGAGFTESAAVAEGITVISAKQNAMNKHSMINGKKAYTVKLVFSKDDGRIIGGQIVSSSECPVRYIDVIALAIRSRLTALDLTTFRCAGQPELSPEPSAEPISIAAEQAWRTLVSGT
ncbi:MAG: FAD-dependent oxidoreductase [Candidatus Hydrogenedentes bacterium]|nr:FAD-dependent oxidoreductase [Candidatus Hydrogenedentota bacterium]